MLTECHKPSFKLLPAKETGRASIGMIDLERFGESGVYFPAFCGLRVFSEQTSSYFRRVIFLLCFTILEYSPLLPFFF
jgi:hypothetical protein